MLIVLGGKSQTPGINSGLKPRLAENQFAWTGCTFYKNPGSSEKNWVTSGGFKSLTIGMAQSTVHDLKTGIRAETFKTPDLLTFKKNYFNSECHVGIFDPAL